MDFVGRLGPKKKATFFFLVNPLGDPFWDPPDFRAKGPKKKGARFLFFAKGSLAHLDTMRRGFGRPPHLSKPPA